MLKLLILCLFAVSANAFQNGNSKNNELTSHKSYHRASTGRSSWDRSRKYSSSGGSSGLGLLGLLFGSPTYSSGYSQGYGNGYSSSYSSNTYGAGYCCQGSQAWYNYRCRTDRNYFYYCTDYSNSNYNQYYGQQQQTQQYYGQQQQSYYPQYYSNQYYGQQQQQQSTYPYSNYYYSQNQYYGKK